jgi:hypothetical protein
MFNSKLDYLKGIPKNLLKSGAILIAVNEASAIMIPIIGFTKAGVLAGSKAAMMQAGIGNVVAGSQFAFLQSAGALGQGILGASLAPIIIKGAIIGGVGYTIYYVVKNRPKL